MDLTLCLLVKDENSYLQEWLDYHILLGVEHFWIYDNESTVPINESLRTYVEAGWVTVHTIKGKGRDIQLYAYDHCVQTYGPFSHWIGFIDTDEFIVPHTTENLRDFLLPYENFGGLAISSLFFGNGGNKTRPNLGQVSGYKYRTPEKLSTNRHVKMIIQPERVLLPISPHSFFFKEGFYSVNESGLRVDAQKFPCHVDRIQLNHYFTRSDEEWFKKLSRWKGDIDDRLSDDRWEKVNMYSTCEDIQAITLFKKMIMKHGLPANNPARKSEIHEKDMVTAAHQIVKSFAAPRCDLPDGSQEVQPRAEAIKYFEENACGTHLLDSGQIAEARKYHALEIEKYPFDMIRYTNYASLCLELGDAQSAWPAIAQAWKLAPRSLYVLLCMIDYFFAIKDYAQVEKTSFLAMTQGELESQNVAILAIAQWNLGKQDLARATARPLLAGLTQNDLKKPLINEVVTLLKK